MAHLNHFRPSWPDFMHHQSTNTLCIGWLFSFPFPSFFVSETKLSLITSQGCMTKHQAVLLPLTQPSEKQMFSSGTPTHLSLTVR